MFAFDCYGVSAFGRIFEYDMIITILYIWKHEKIRFKRDSYGYNLAF